MDKLKLLSIFTKVAEQGGFSQAASTLGQTPSTVSKAIARLESNLGVTLLDRNTRHIRLTQAGEDYYRVSKSLLKDLEDCEQALQARNNRPNGVLKINLPTAYGRLYITKMLSQFQREHPDIAIHAAYSDEYINMVEHGFDLTIRTGQLNDCNLIARQLSPMDFVICGAPALFEQRGVPTNKQALAQMPWVQFKFSETGRAMAITLPDNSQLKLSEDAKLVVSDGESMVELCCAGHGLIQAPHFLVRHALESGRLRVLFPPQHIGNFAVYALYQKQQHLPEKIRLFVDMLIHYLAERGESCYKTWASDLTPLITHCADDTAPLAAAESTLVSHQ